MKARFTTLAMALIAATAIMAVAAGAASAKGGVIKTTARFHIQYSSGAITSNGEVRCKGRHQTNSALYPGTATEGGRDIEKCKSTSHKAFTALTAGQEGNMFPGSPSYESDWFYLKGESGASIASIHVHFAVSANDKAFTLLVYVPLEGKYPAIAESL
jgi:hypothetical protein